MAAERVSSEGESSICVVMEALTAATDSLNYCSRIMPKNFLSGPLDQTDVDGEDGEGECRTGSGRSQHHRPAGKHTHPRSV